MTFESGNVDDLKDKIEKMFSSDFDNHNIAETVMKRYNVETYYEEIMKCYES